MGSKELGVKDEVSWLEVITELEEGEVFAVEESEIMQDNGLANLSNKEKGSSPTRFHSWIWCWMWSRDG